MRRAISVAIAAIMGNAAVAQSDLRSTALSTNNKLTLPTSPPDLPRDADEVRLLLQHAIDHGGSFQSYPSELSAAIGTAEKAGWLAMHIPPSTPIKDKDGNVVGASSSGVTSWTITDAGRQELAERNGRLGNAATRMAHETRFIPGAGVVAYGAPRRVPLTAPITIRDGGVVTK